MYLHISTHTHMHACMIVGVLGYDTKIDKYTPVGLEIIISGSLVEEENILFILLVSFVNTPPPPPEEPPPSLLSF